MTTRADHVCWRDVAPGIQESNYGGLHCCFPEEEQSM
jgi:hypothetical protein